MPQFIIPATVVGVLILGPAAARAGDSPDPYEELLAQHGMKTDDDIRRYLEQLHPGPDARNQVALLIRQLGDDDFFKREEAMQQLIRKPVAATEPLQQAAEAEDPEVRWRANHVLKHRDRQSGQILRAVLRVIADRELKGLTEQVIAAVPLCDKLHVRIAAIKALKATATRSDVALLRESLHADDAPVRMAACSVFQMLLGETSSEHLVPLLEDPQEQVRLAAAGALANHGDRRCLAALGKLLESEDSNVRSRSVYTLRALTGKRFGFVAYERPDKRSGPAGTWQAWIEREGSTAELTFPVKDAGSLFGRTLICSRTENTVREVDADGKATWKVPVSSPYGCHALPNGHRLVASYSGRSVTEYDADGEEVWKVTNLPASPYSVRRLDSGNTLVACYSSKKVVEIKPDKTIAWEVTLDDRPLDARRLENGNTLVCLYSTGQVVEVDRAGKTVWRLPIGGRSYSAQRLSNGNTLVGQYSQGLVVELDRGGRQVWSKAGTGRMYDAQRLTNGNTLFVDSTGAHEVAPGGDVVWEHKAVGLRRAFRY